MYYVGTTFNPADGGYKTLQNAKKAAKKINGNVYDENGEVVFPETDEPATVEAAAETTAETAAETAQDDAETGAAAASEEIPAETENTVNEAQDAAEVVTVELTDEVPDGALEGNDDGSVNAYNEDGEKVGTISAETAAAAQEAAGAAVTGDGSEVIGAVKVVRAGMLAVRNAPSWKDGHKCGIVKKGYTADVVQRFNIDGGVIYKMANGRYISGKDGDTEFTPA